ncbi:tRNA (guanosine(37)-N1)-methyltransferase TrmD [Roseicella sp. DB1501]|uniref:tRNA (guanosine(37)-N1)-methyltransferase TrmD n=1 Tax=Roseicella sp. DB1501 TaxID=2730925 RepID=UPI001491AB67|nr:tRNA (guanosine(37)-N1)-methyltransferase TrmD [Roseicella sp. DB1501]NOG70387.1 tRNA (guanosine(37)-N1)-methyltransferase TrmD [Roseicella sp. DB1501]
MSWRATILTLFPEMFPGPLGQSLAGRALREGRWRIDSLDIRGFATDRHRTVDDTPFGGGAGMVMRPDVLDAALAAAMAEDAAPGEVLGEAPGEVPGAPDRGAPQGAERESVARRVSRPALYLTPRGRVLDQALVRQLAAGPGVILLCGRYEGVDQRVIEARELIEVSVGDYVLSGGETAAMVLLDACVRLLPGVMGGAGSAEEESFSAGGREALLEYPHYTRPAEWQGRAVPPVLLSGHHAEVARWRQAEAERITRERRPDLWARYAKGAPAAGTEPPRNVAEAEAMDGRPAAA